MAEITTQDKIPSYQEKKFVELEQPSLFQALENGRFLSKTIESTNLPLSQLTNKGGQAVRDAASYYTSKGLGGLTVGQLREVLKDTNSVSQYGLGKTFSYQDLAQEALQGDPNFDPADTDSVVKFATDLEKRGLTNQNRDKIYSLATTQSVQGTIDKAVNPGKYLTDEKKAANTATSQRLLQQYGFDADPDLQEFISERLAGGESAFELGQFLQTTPQFQEKKATAENERVKTESAGAREALNQELLKSQQEVFQRAQPSIISSYMKAGRLNSSGLNNALAQAQTELEKERQGFLANAGYNDAIRAQGYGREDFVNNNAQAFNQYLRQNEPAYQQRYAVNQAQNNLNYQQPFANLNRQYGLLDESRQRGYQLEDYNRQQSDFNRYLDQSRKQSKEAALYGLFGAGIGAATGGWGMAAGAAAGAANKTKSEPEYNY